MKGTHGPRRSGRYLALGDVISERESGPKVRAMTRADSDSDSDSTKPIRLWRGERHENKARETAYVTRALSDYGAACRIAATCHVKPIAWHPATDAR